MAIICGTDLSTASGGALEVAVALAEQRGDKEVVLVHVVDPEQGASDSAREGALEEAQQQLDAQAAQFAKPAVTVRVQLVVGPSADTLVGLAETEHTDLLVIRARSAPGTEPLGTTTQRVIARTHVPVLVVRDPKPWLAFARKERPLRLLVGIDDSATSDLGVQWTHALRDAGQVDVILGAIYYPDDAATHYGLERRNMVDRDPEVEELMSRDLLRRFGTARDVVARPRRGLGRIGDHMVELANEEKVDAIVVGTSQKTGLGRLGSVSSVIVADSTQSVVCVPPNAAIPTYVVPQMKTVVVATDMSSFANRAVAYAFGVADADAVVHLVHVTKEDDIDHGELSKQLQTIAPRGAKQNVVPHVIQGDDAAETIAQCAARLGADCICIASHGRSGFTRALMGSVADRLLRATRLPVLVLRPG
jgi:nucleotide-binding universal stress UspA family protein